MKALAPLLLGLALLATRSAASAQTNNTGPMYQGMVVAEIDGEAIDTYFINKSQCEDNVQLKFIVSGIATANINVIEVWRGDASENCNDVSGRQVPNQGGSVPCELIASTDEISATPSFPLRAKELFDCKDGSVQTIYFVPLSSRTPDNAAMAPANPTGKTYNAKFNVDVTPPAAATGIKASDGEREIGASWKASDDMNIRRYTLYFDKSGIGRSGDPCSSELLKKGDFAKSDSDIYKKSVSSNQGGASPKSLGLSLGEQIPLAVATQDLAENDSKLSEVVCASYIETQGFLEKYEAEGGDGLDECSAHPFRPSHAWSGWLLLALGGVLLVRRKA